MQNAPRENSAILSTVMKLPFVFKAFVLSIFEWPLKTGFTVVKFKNARTLIWRLELVQIFWVNRSTLFPPDTTFDNNSLLENGMRNVLQIL